MLTFPCLCTIASITLMVLPRLVGTATEFGMDRNVVVVMWQIWGGTLRPRRASLLSRFHKLGSRRARLTDEASCRSRFG